MANKQVALIREEECTGCTKCIQACPVDAILGARELMHTVIESECIGCELCIPPCPVDCIDLVPAHHTPDPTHTRMRVQNRKTRLQLSANTPLSPDETDIDARKRYVMEALQRAGNRKRNL